MTGKINPEDNITLVILAGGNGSRMEKIGKIAPKPLLPALDEPLIIRHIRYAQEARIKNIIISTSPQYYSCFRETLSCWNTDKSVNLVKNQDHTIGPLPALLRIMQSLTSFKILLSLADIFFLDNPYGKISQPCELYPYRLGFSPVFNRNEFSLGGIIFTNPNQKSLARIVKKPIKENKDGKRWNGLAYFDVSQSKALHNFLNLYQMASPLEDFFEYLHQTENISFRLYKCPDFINVNRPEDFLQASLYRYSELFPKAQIKSLANRLRHHYLSKF